MIIEGFFLAVFILVGVYFTIVFLDKRKLNKLRREYDEKEDLGKQGRIVGEGRNSDPIAAFERGNTISKTKGTNAERKQLQDRVIDSIGKSDTINEPEHPKVSGSNRKFRIGRKK